MLYAWIKIAHIISAAVLFGTGLGTACYMLYVNQQKNIALIAHATKQVVWVDWIFTGGSAIAQLTTGIILVAIKEYAPFSFWIVGSVIGYFIAGACWIPVVYFQIRCRDLAFEALQNCSALPEKYYHYYRLWKILGIPAFLSLLVVFYLMANRPMGQ